MTQFTANDLIGRLVDNIDVLEREETALLRYVDEHRLVFNINGTPLLQKSIKHATKILNENMNLLETVLAHKTDGILPFLDTMPFRIAILRLKAAILLTEKFFMIQKSNRPFYERQRHDRE